MSAALKAHASLFLALLVRLAAAQGLRGSTSAGNESSQVIQASSSSPCLCIFDVDRTLTGKQGADGQCPGNKAVPGVYDPAYGGGVLTLSRLAVEGLDKTFCGSCYLGVISAGNAGGKGSAERAALMQVMRSGPMDALRSMRGAREWCYGGHVDCPFVLSQPDRKKQWAVQSIMDWYKGMSIQIKPSHVHFFGDRTENISPFGPHGFNAREISCGSRDMSIHHGMVGLCGARPEEVVPDLGVRTCGRPELDSSPGRGGHEGMSICQGDCDKDEDCAGSLQCFHRSSNEAVPGCSGTGVEGFDYCIAAPAGTTEPTPAPGSPELDSSPGGDGKHGMTVCQGDCDKDEDCAGSLRCFQRSGQELVPGCSGRGLWGWDYCAALPPAPLSTPAPAPAPTPTDGEAPRLDSTPGHDGVGKPLQRCQGDCDEDADCAAGLKCFQRHSYEAVPGCSGTGPADFDYCYEPKVVANPGVNPAPQVPVTTSAKPSTAPAGPVWLDSRPGADAAGGKLGLCQGDCDRDTDCAPGLRCFQRHGYGAVPGCWGWGMLGWDYCVAAPGH